MQNIYEIIKQIDLLFDKSYYYIRTRRNNIVDIKDYLTIDNLLSKLGEIEKSESYLSISSIERIIDKKKQAKNTIDLAFKNLYSLFEKNGDYTTKLKRYIQSVLNDRLNFIAPNRTHTHTYKAQYTGYQRTIDFAFGGENKKKARKLKKYIP